MIEPKICPISLSRSTRNGGYPHCNRHCSKTARPIPMLFNAWRSQMFALSDSEEIMSLSITVWPQSTNVTDRRRQTTTTDDDDRQACGNTDSLAYSHESAKIVFLHTHSSANNLQFFFQKSHTQGAFVPILVFLSGSERFS